MEETLKGGRGPPWAVAPLERERACNVQFFHHMFCADNILSSASLNIKNSLAFARRGLARVL
jgi:hypothetical protein